MGRSSSARAVVTAEPIATSVPPPRTQSELFPAGVADAIGPTPFLVVSPGIEPGDDGVAARAIGEHDRVMLAGMSPLKSVEAIVRWLKPYCSNSHFIQPPGMLLAPRHRPMRVAGLSRTRRPARAIGGRDHQTRRDGHVRQDARRLEKGAQSTFQAHTCDHHSRMPVRRDTSRCLPPAGARRR